MVFDGWLSRMDSYGTCILESDGTAKRFVQLFKIHERANKGTNLHFGHFLLIMFFLLINGSKWVSHI